MTRLSAAHPVSSLELPAPLFSSLLRRYINTQTELFTRPGLLLRVVIIAGGVFIALELFEAPMRTKSLRLCILSIVSDASLLITSLLHQQLIPSPLLIDCPSSPPFPNCLVLSTCNTKNCHPLEIHHPFLPPAYRISDIQI
jgi:hypothetical protein